MRQHDFADHEVVSFWRALEWFDRSDVAAAGAHAAPDPAEAARHWKLATDAAQTGLRFWRTLKFPVPPGVRRPGRPAGADWSPARKAMAR